MQQATRKSPAEYACRVMDAAALIYTACERGEEDDSQIMRTIASTFRMLGLIAPDDVANVTAAIQAIPGQCAPSPSDRDGLEHLQEILEVPTFEDECAARVRAARLLKALYPGAGTASS